MALPTFIVAGAPKCGTTALWAYLNEHPQVCMSQIKEPRFFSDAADGVLETGSFTAGHLRSGTHGKGREWYESLFRACPDRPARGEASTQYFSIPNAPRMIHDMLPNARLIFMLRDPVARAYSHYWQEAKLGLELPDFAIMREQHHPRLRYYLSVSQYKTHIENYLRVFAKDRVLVLLDDELKQAPQDTLRRVYAFIGVDPEFTPDCMGQQFNRQTQPKHAGLQKKLASLAASPLIQRIPEAIRRPVGRIARALARHNTVPADIPPLPAEIRAELLPRFAEDIAFIEQWLGRDLPVWRAA